ncbi:putative MIP aquaporin (TC 1.A.8) family protein [Lyophyllum shimeji]|uniref:MIP aquaporin (TC 1.A.8) family protein n=1 Tax=Lyophyllum shimeji TaxID=47721 RepID=A0A9P3PS97_LYOSH|nr:putative MIP aquaporin (TC 1.A.8) family protein [Lyophyllum shimeji]
MAAPIVHLRDIQKRQKFFNVWEKQRNKKEVHWLMEMFAESLGVFFYVYAGIGSVAGWVVGNIIQQSGLSSLLQIGFAYACGILFAIGVCSATSGGHFNPCITVSYVVFRGFPPLKAFRYIFAQIVGAYVACLLVYSQWKVLIVQCEAILQSAGKLEALQFTPNGPAGIFGLYLLPGQTLPRVFLNEFVIDTALGLVIYAAIDPSNAMVPPVLAPFLVALAYGTAIWSFATAGVALNSARDIGGRLVAMTIWGREAAGGKFAAIAALTNIPATLLGAFIYEFFLTDSDRVVPTASLEYGQVLANHRGLRKAQTEARRQSRQSIIEFPNAMELQTPAKVENKANGIHYAITTD